MRTLTLDVVGPRGRILHAEQVESVVVRRREPDFDPGSEVALLKGHAPLFMQVQPCEVRFTHSRGTNSLQIGQALLEVWEDTVTIALT